MPFGGLRTRLVGSHIGRSLQIARAARSLRSIPFANPEKASVIANGIIADRLIARVPRSSFLDIGAHIGSVFSSVHRANPTVKCAAIEADQDKALRLATAFPYCRIERVAVGETERVAKFHLAENSGYNSLAKIDGATRTIEVQVNRLDDLFPTETFDCIKIDIEGVELGAFRGGEDLIRRSQPVIMFESTGTRENSLGYSAASLFDWLDGRDFLTFTPDRVAHDAPPLSREVFLDAHHYPMRTHNYFAVPLGRREEVRGTARHVLGIIPRS